MIVSPGAALPSPSTSGNESVFVAVMVGANGAGGSMPEALSTRLENFAAPCASGASGLRSKSEMMRHAIKALEV